MLADMGRPKTNDFPPYMARDGDRGGFIVRNPITGRKKRFAAAQEELARQTAARLAQWVQAQRDLRTLNSGRPTVSRLIDLWLEQRLPLMPWDASTRSTVLMRLTRIRREMGDQVVAVTDCVAIEAWLSRTAARADPFNKWRHVWVLLWRFAVSQRLASSNEAEKVERRSISRKIKGNQKVRHQLDVAGFQAIREHAPAWLQIAMDVSLLTLQARKEVCRMRHADFRNGYLFVIRDKVAGDSAMAFIKIKLTAELEALRARALTLDGIASPFLVHRRPDRMQRRWTKGKDHWTYVNEHYLTQRFAAARDQVERYAALPERERPTFHEIRGLGSRRYLELGVSKAAIQSLMTHSSQRTTEIYLERGPEALTDDDFHTVTAPFTLEQLLGA